MQAYVHDDRASDMGSELTGDSRKNIGNGKLSLDVDNARTIIGCRAGRMKARAVRDHVMRYI